MTTTTGPDCVVMCKKENSCGHPTAPFAKLGVGTRASYRGGNQVQGAGRSERGRGQDQNRGRVGR